MTGMTPHELFRAAQMLAERVPDAVLVKNEVGNLTVLDAENRYIGWLNLGFEAEAEDRVTLFDAEEIAGYN